MGLGLKDVLIVREFLKIFDVLVQYLGGVAMKKFLISILAVSVMVSAAGCQSGGDSSESQSVSQTKELQAAQSDEAENATEAETSAETAGTGEAAESGETSEGNGNILIVYFSVPENADIEGATAVSGASIVVRDGEKLGNTKYMAQIIQQNTGGDIFRIETVQEYPLDHDPLVDMAAEEQDNEARPSLKALPENLEDYDTVFIGYPNWWGDMPMPLYTFLESVDLSGKTIIPFCPHGGSGFSRTVSEIAQMQPEAEVSENGLAISRNDVDGSEDEIVDWLDSLGMTAE